MPVDFSELIPAGQWQRWVSADSSLSEMHQSDPEPSLQRTVSIGSRVQDALEAGQTYQTKKVMPAMILLQRLGFALFTLRVSRM